MPQIATDGLCISLLVAFLCDHCVKQTKDVVEFKKLLKTYCLSNYELRVTNFWSVVLIATGY